MFVALTLLALSSVVDQSAYALCGGSISRSFVKTLDKSTASQATCKLGYTFSLPKITPLALNVNVVIPHGVGAQLDLKILNIGGFSLSPIAGVFFNLVKPVNNTWYSRSTDWTLGLRAEQRIGKHLAIVVEQQQYLLNLKPRADFGVLATPMYDEARKHGQTWIGVSYHW